MGEPEGTVAKKLLFAAFSDSTEDELGPAALDDSGAAAAAASPAGSAAALETGLIMLLANDPSRQAERPPSILLALLRAPRLQKLRRDYGDLKSYVIV